MKMLFLVVIFVSISIHANEKGKVSGIENNLQRYRKLKRQSSHLKRSYAAYLEIETSKTKRADIIKKYHRKRLKLLKKADSLQRVISVEMATSRADYVCGRGKLFERGALMICEDGSQWRKTGASVSPKSSVWDTERSDSVKQLYEYKNGFPHYDPRRVNPK